jgi:hypothetical protein
MMMTTISCVFVIENDFLIVFHLIIRWIILVKDIIHVKIMVNLWRIIKHAQRNSFVYMSTLLLWWKMSIFSISTFIFSLHSILEYHIKAKISLHRQSLIIQISILLFIAGTLSRSLSLSLSDDISKKKSSTSWKRKWSVYFIDDFASDD